VHNLSACYRNADHQVYAGAQTLHLAGLTGNSCKELQVSYNVT